MDFNVETLIDPKIIEEAEKRYRKAMGDDAPPMRYGVCLYTDGGGKIETNYGLTTIYSGSFGVHGYIYIKDFVQKQGNGVTGYTLTDKGYILNGMLDTEIEVVNVEFNKDPEKLKVEVKQDIVPLVYYNSKGGIEGGTNNVGETTGLIEAMQFIGAISKELQIDEITLALDSKYVIDNFLSLDTYHQNGWRKRDGQQIANLELWQYLDKVYRENIDPSQSVNIYWVKGHDDNFGNNQADVLSSRALVGAINGYYGIDRTISPAKGFWSGKTFESHPFLLESHWYFKNNLPLLTEDGDYKLCIGLHDAKEDRRFCQPNSTDIFGIVRLKKIPSTLTKIYELSTEVSSGNDGYSFENIFYSNLRNLLNTTGEDYINDNNGINIHRDINRSRLLLPNKKAIAVMFDPPRLSPLAFNKHFPYLDSLLERVRTNTLYANEALTDITDTFYKKTLVKNKEVNTLTIGNDIRYPVMVNYKQIDGTNSVYTDKQTEVILTLGITAPRKRVLSNVKDLEPKVSVLTVLDGSTLHHFSIIELSSGEIGIWTNPFSNQKLIIN